MQYNVNVQYKVSKHRRMYIQSRKHTKHNKPAMNVCIVYLVVQDKTDVARELST